MTTLYKPVLIESAEQAEQLPEGAVLIREGHFAFQKYEHLRCDNCGAHARGTTTLKNPTRTRSAR